MAEKAQPPPPSAPYFAERQAGYDQAAPPAAAAGYATQPSEPPPPYDSTLPAGYAPPPVAVTQPVGHAGAPQQSYFVARQAGYDQRPMVQQPAPQQVSNVNTTVVVQNGGNCPYCQTGVIVNEADGCAWAFGIILAILFFPIGVLCCLCLVMANEQRCTHCRRTI